MLYVLFKLSIFFIEDKYRVEKGKETLGTEKKVCIWEYVLKIV